MCTLQLYILGELFVVQRLARVSALAFVLGTMPAIADQTGWQRLIEPDTSKPSSGLPKIMQPQPSWSQVADIVNTDGTTSVPSCAAPNVIDTVKNGILEALNQQGNSVTAGNFQLFDSVSMGTIWVHQTFQGGYVCDSAVSADMGGTATAADNYQFETFAQDGQAYVFFIDTTENQ